MKANHSNLSKPPLTSLEQLMVKNKLRKGIISDFYNLLISTVAENSRDKLMSWNVDLSLSLGEQEWERACVKTHTISINIHLRMLQYKWLMCVYITPVQLNKYNNNIPDVCIKCGSKGTLIHCMWECRQIKIFWEEVKTLIEKITSKHSFGPKIIFISFIPRQT